MTFRILLFSFILFLPLLLLLFWFAHITHSHTQVTSHVGQWRKWRNEETKTTKSKFCHSHRKTRSSNFKLAIVCFSWILCVSIRWLFILSRFTILHWNTNANMCVLCVCVDCVANVKYKNCVIHFHFNFTDCLWFNLFAEFIFHFCCRRMNRFESIEWYLSMRHTTRWCCLHSQFSLFSISLSISICSLSVSLADACVCMCVAAALLLETKFHERRQLLWAVIISNNKQHPQLHYTAPFAPIFVFVFVVVVFIAVRIRLHFVCFLFLL